MTIETFDIGDYNSIIICDRCGANESAVAELEGGPYPTMPGWGEKDACLKDIEKIENHLCPACLKDHDEMVRNSGLPFRRLGMVL